MMAMEYMCILPEWHVQVLKSKQTIFHATHVEQCGMISQHVPMPNETGNEYAVSAHKPILPTVSTVRKTKDYI